MHTLAMLLKSYAPDLAYAERLVTSFTQFNHDSIPLYIVVPDEEISLFAKFSTSTIEVLGESILGSHLVDTDVHGLRPGYINQEIIKLAFWELGLAENYFCVDSEALFIRAFFTSDFMATPEVPYTVLVEDNELKVEPNYFNQYWVQREASLREIQRLVGLDDPIIRTCHGHQVFSTTVLRSFVDEFLIPKGWAYRDALAAAPYEFSWYNMWLQKTKVIPIHQREPLVKVFHNEDQHLEYILRGVTVQDIARGYLAVVVNSSYARELKNVTVRDGKAQSIAPYLSYGEVSELIAEKIKDTFKRRFGSGS
jgi:hypothetical protein